MGTFLKENAEYFEKKAKEAYLEKKYKLFYSSLNNQFNYI